MAKKITELSKLVVTNENLLICIRIEFKSHLILFNLMKWFQLCSVNRKIFTADPNTKVNTVKNESQNKIEIDHIVVNYREEIQDNDIFFLCIRKHCWPV